MMEKGLQLKPTAVSLLSVVSRAFEKLFSDFLFLFLFSDFQCSFWSSQSTTDLLTVASDRIARAFNRSKVTRAVGLDTSKTFDRFCHAGLLHKLKSYAISGKIFGFTPSFLSTRWLEVVLDGKFSQEYPVNAGVPQGSIFGPTFLVLHINKTLLSMLMILLSTRSVITDLTCCNNENWYLNINLI